MFNLQKRRTSYEPLALDEPDTSHDEGNATRHGLSHYSSAGALLLCLLCTIINILVWRRTSPTTGYSFPSSTTFLTSRGVSRQDLDNLRRPSQFVGLEKIHRNIPPTNKSFLNFPLVLAQIDSSEPNRVHSPLPGVFTSIGTIYPEVGQVVVSNSISTIVQFRALDFGMEACELRIEIPTNASMVSANRTLTLSSSSLEIFAVDYNKRLHADTLSYASRPTRGNKIADVVLGYGAQWTHHFSCRMDDMFAFELTCPLLDDGTICGVRWEQDKEHDSSPVIVMIQHSTL